MTDRLVFHHLPKTGGTSVVEMLEAQVPSGLMRPPELMRSSRTYPPPVLVRGHFTFSKDLYDYLNGLGVGPYTWATMLRHPVDRCISDYYFFDREGEDMLEYIEHGKQRPARAKPANLMTRHLAGPDGTAEQAIEILDEFYPLVGLLEWLGPCLPHKNKNRNGPYPEASDYTRYRIGRLNHHDMKVYAWAKRNWQRDVAFKQTLIDRRLEYDLAG